MLFLNNDGTVKSHQKISDTEGGFTGILSDRDFFGASVASLGDLDGDGVQDLAVGAYRDDDGGSAHGAVWILFLNTDGTVKSQQKISDTEGGFDGILDNDDFFSTSVASLGDLDGVSCDPCDMNCDADVNAFDIEPVLDLLFGGAAPCEPCTGDANNDGDINAFDIEPFLSCLFGP